MKKETIFGLILIALSVIAFSYINRPKYPTEIQQQKQSKFDNETTSSKTQESSSLSHQEHPDSVALSESSFFPTRGEETIVKLENSKISVDINSKGAIPCSVMLKEYENLNPKKKENNNNVALFQKGDFDLNFIFRTVKGQILSSNQLYFTPVYQSKDSVTMRLSLDSLSFLDLTYTLSPDDYFVTMQLSGKNLSNFFPSNMRFLDFELQQRMPQVEKSWKNENNYTGIYYKFLNDDVKRLKETKKSAKKDISEPLHWIAFKDKFFASVLISDKKTSIESTLLEQGTLPQEKDYTKKLFAQGAIPYDIKNQDSLNLFFYFGPLEHKLLTSYDKGVEKSDKLHLEKLIYVGGSVFRAINLYLILPIVSFLSKFVSNWGIIILLLTLIIKIILSPLTFKSYFSQAKMRVLKPQVEAINAQYPGNDQQMQLKRSQATMALYRNAGASPMAGCLPMLLQMPFLIALYMFFPTAIYLRGESFLWAKDLSSYDAILSWNFDIPILTGLMGNHISLFCLLWAITNILYSRYTMSTNATGQDNPQMQMMKWMPFIMSLMFFFFFNNNASGLCYYYFISTLITILQYVASRMMIDEEKVLARLEANKKKPKKKSGFMARLEEAQRMQEKAMRERQKQNKR